MKQKLWLVPAGALLGLGCGGLVLTLGSGSVKGRAAWLLALGEGLRELSLSGFWGNLAAWGIVLLVSALPVAALILLDGKRRAADEWLLGLMSPVLLASFWLLVNPTHMGWMVREIFPVAAGWTLLSMALAFVALRLLRALEEASRKKLARAFALLLYACAALTAFAAALGQVLEGKEQWAEVVAGNTNPGSLTPLMILLLCLLSAAPGILSALTMLWGADLALALGREDFDEAGVALCERTALACRMVAQATVVLAVSGNLIQLALLEQLRATHFSLTMPLVSLLLSVGLMLLCRLLQRGQELQKDSDSII